MPDAPASQPQTRGRPPLDPWALVVASFVLAPIGAGIVLSVNDARLGARDRAPLTFYLFFFVALLGYLVLARLHAEHVVSFRSRAGWLAARVVLGLVAGGLAWWWSRRQHARFVELRRAFGRTGNPLPVCMPALLASVFLDMLVWQVFIRA